MLQEVQGPPRRFRGQRLILSGRGHMWVRVRSAGRTSWPPLLRKEEKRVHTSSVYFLSNLVYWVQIYDSWTCA